MTWGSFLLYAFPSFLMACAGYGIPKLDFDISFKFFFFVMATMLTLVFSHYFTLYLRSDEMNMLSGLEKNIEKLKDKISDLEKDIEKKDVAYAKELAEINNRINDHLKNTSKSDAGNLWDDMNTISNELFNNFQNRMT